MPLNSDIDTVHCSVKLLVGVCSKPGTLSPVSVLLTQKAGVAEELMQSLVERLETDEPEAFGKSPIFCWFLFIFWVCLGSKVSRRLCAFLIGGEGL